MFDLPYDTVIASPPQCNFRDAPSIWHIWTGITGVTHPPLYYLTLRAWIDCFGDSDLSTRLLSTFFSLAIIPLIFDVARRGSFSAMQGLAAAAMLALAPAQIDFSQTVRPYTMLVFLGVLAADLLLIIQRKGPSWARFAALTAAIVALALTHYFSAGALLAMGLFALIQLRGRTRSAVVGALVVAFVIVLVAWGPMFWRARGLVTLDAYVRGKGIGIGETFLNLPRRLLLHISLETGFLSMLAMAVVVYISPLLRLKRWPHLLLWWLWALCTAGFLLAWDEVRGTHLISVTRYVLLVSPAIFIILAAPFSTWIGRFVPLVFVFAAAASGLARWQEGPMGTPDVRAAAGWIASDLPPGEPVIIYGGNELDASFDYFAIAHYAGDWRRPVVLLHDPASADLQEQLKHYPQLCIWSRGDFPARILPGWEARVFRQADGVALYQGRPR
jgi:uncharacterized membrane protein